MTIVRRPAFVMVTLAVLVVALALLTNVLPFRQIVEQRQQVADAQTRLDSLLSENELLEDQVAALDTPLEIERIAREQLGYVRPGEEAFVLVEPEDGPVVEPVEPDRSAADGGGAGWLQRIWAFLTGADLAGG